jgi:hypothetical protein
MGVVLTLCYQLPCKLPLVVQAPSTRLERVAPFLLGIFILAVSVMTTHEVIERTTNHLLGGHTKDELDSIKPNLSPKTYVLGLPWVVDVAQIPALLGTPLAGLFVLKHNDFLVLYTAVLTAGLMIFFYFLRKVPVNDYRKWGYEVVGYRVSVLVIGGIALNAVCGGLAVLAT